MFSKFTNLDSEKQTRIINAALNEFAHKGYEKASTNEIVKSAGISKGILFHYFENKKTLFLYLYDYGIEVTLKDYYQKISFEETDFFDMQLQLLKIKLKLVEKYPQIFRFFEKVYLDTSDEIKLELDMRNENLKKTGYQDMFSHIDLSKFKEGLDITKVINIIKWSMEGYSVDLLKNSQLSGKDVDYTQVYAEFESYIKIFRNSFYK